MYKTEIYVSACAQTWEGQSFLGYFVLYSKMSKYSVYNQEEVSMAFKNIPKYSNFCNWNECALNCPCGFALSSVHTSRC